MTESRESLLITELEWQNFYTSVQNDILKFSTMSEYLASMDKKRFRELIHTFDDYHLFFMMGIATVSMIILCSSVFIDLYPLQKDKREVALQAFMTVLLATIILNRFIRKLFGDLHKSISAYGVDFLISSTLIFLSQAYWQPSFLTLLSFLLLRGIQVYFDPAPDQEYSYGPLKALQLYLYVQKIKSFFISNQPISYHATSNQYLDVEINATLTFNDKTYTEDEVLGYFYTDGSLEKFFSSALNTIEKSNCCRLLAFHKKANTEELAMDFSVSFANEFYSMNTIKCSASEGVEEKDPLCSVITLEHAPGVMVFQSRESSNPKIFYSNPTDYFFSLVESSKGENRMNPNYVHHGLQIPLRELAPCIKENKEMNEICKSGAVLRACKDKFFSAKVSEEPDVASSIKMKNC